MSKVRIVAEDVVEFQCPGCGYWHRLSTYKDPDFPGPTWNWNGSLDAPTLQPSILFTSGHFAFKAGQEDHHCWCSYEARLGKPAPFHCVRCHSFVTDGRIQFLADCSHALAGHTVDLPDLPDE